MEQVGTEIYHEHTTTRPPSPTPPLPPKEYVIGDIHGGYKALKQVLEKSKFRYDIDRLICLGDVCDGWSETKACIDELLKIQHLILIKGNHDHWFERWLMYGESPRIWTSQGGNATIGSYSYSFPTTTKETYDTHIRFLGNAMPYYLDHKNRLFVHGGINTYLPINAQDHEDLIWDRELLNVAFHTHQINPQKKLTGFNEIYIGHTSTLLYHSIKPLHYCEVWNIDTGGGFGGVLTIMDINTHEYWQSDFVKDLYKDERGR